MKQSELVYNLAEDGHTSIDLYSMEGILLKKIKNNEFHAQGMHQVQIPLGTYPRGVYMIKVQHNDQIKMERILLK